jgi:putative DNA primase/helicase
MKSLSLQDVIQNNNALPTIKFQADNVAAAIDELEAKLCEANAPIYVRAGVLVQPLWADLNNAKGDKVRSSHFKPITYKNLAYMLTKHVATFQKYSLTEEEWVGCLPPEIVLEGLLQLGHWKFSRVTGVINAPTLRPDGSFIPSFFEIKESAGA